jgi:hypothetical protein
VFNVGALLSSSDEGRTWRQTGPSHEAPVYLALTDELHAVGASGGLTLER